MVSGPENLAPVTLEVFSRKRIGQSPRTPPCFIPGNPHQSLSGMAREADDDKIPLLAMTPAPGHQVEMTLIVRPPLALAQAPLPFSCKRFSRCRGVSTRTRAGAEILAGLAVRFAGLAADAVGLIVSQDVLAHCWVPPVTRPAPARSGYVSAP
jgi:hypothetical protein